MRAALLMLLTPQIAAGQACYSTPEAAARSVIGAMHEDATGRFRPAGVQVDVVMKRVWIRVVQCSDGSAPPVLVPVSVPLVTSEEAVPRHDVSTSRPPSHPILHPGDSVQAIFSTATTHMTLEASVNAAAGIGDTVSLTLKRRPGQPLHEPEHRIRGIVRADGTVEVQP